MLSEMLQTDLDVPPISPSEAKQMAVIVDAMVAATRNDANVVLSVRADMVAPLMLTIIAGLRQSQAWADGDLMVDPPDEPGS